MFYFELATLQNFMHSNRIFLLDVFTGHKQEARSVRTKEKHAADAASEACCCIFST
jgi:hypothetical protein